MKPKLRKQPHPHQEQPQKKDPPPDKYTIRFDKHGPAWIATLNPNNQPGAIPTRAPYRWQNVLRALEPSGADSAYLTADNTLLVYSASTLLTTLTTTPNGNAFPPT